MITSRSALLSVVLMLFLCSSARSNESAVLQYATNVSDAGTVDRIIDTRSQASCRKSTLADAICIPVEDLMAPQQRLANWSGILWLLGSAGLSGDERVLLIGEKSPRRDFLAGVLLLAGQRQIVVLRQPLSELLANKVDPAKGVVRASTRTQVYSAPMRSELIVLRDELQQLIQGDVVLLDGRTEAEYFGTVIRAARGGHIPGAVYAESLEPMHSQSASSLAIAYAHNTFESLVYLVKLHQQSIAARVYLAGWAEWASDGSLPADSVSYTSKSLSAASVVPDTANDNHRLKIFAAGLLLVLLLGLSFYGGGRFALNTRSR